MSGIRDRRYAVESNRCHCVGCCSVLVYFFNLLTYLCGIGSLIFAVWLYHYNWDYVPIAPNNLYAESIYWLFGFAAAVICSTFVSCLVVRKQNCGRVVCHFIVALLIFGCGIALTTSIYRHFKENFKGNISGTLHDAIIAEYSFVTTKTVSIEKLHRKGQCCGATDFQDWRNSLWWQNANNETDALNGLYTNHVPNVCCKTIVRACGQSDHPSNIFYKGCSKYLEKYFEVRFWSIFTAIAILSVAQLIGAVLEMVLSVELKRHSNSIRQSTRYDGLEKLTSKSQYT